MVFCATDDPKVNDRIGRDASRLGILVNRADRAGAGDFIVPSVARRGHVQMSVCTGGRSPALAKRLRLLLEEHLDPWVRKSRGKRS
jgi:precorrin-2 dehydrogenase/sirohydrochlorin ferrochelatase